MNQLPVIVGFGGYNAAGRSSFHHGFRRMVIESLDAHSRQETLAGLAVMTGLIQAGEEGFATLEGTPLDLAQIEAQFADQILEATLIRRIGNRYFDVEATPWQQSVTVAPKGEKTSFILSKKQLPCRAPSSWTVNEYSDTHVEVVLEDNVEVRVDSYREMPVKSAGQLPDGFDVSKLYNSRFHPRGLQMTIVGMSDALHSIGIDWKDIQNVVRPDEMAVFAGSIMSQLDDNGFGGMMQSRLKGGRVSAKQLPLGLNTMPADFVNAYVLGSLGTTAAASGACATFLYNLKMAVEAIQSGKARVAIAGNSEAPITPEIVEGYAAMSALATVDGLKKVEGTDTPDLRRSSRPFSDNCGFTIAESAQFVVLMDDQLALQLGAQIHGAVTDVFVNADGHKKSISAPGPGNYITLAKAVASARDLLGEESVQQRSMIHAHGSSTPANRVTESELFDRVAQAFDIDSWPLAAVKAYVGHSLAPASGDQLVAALGSFHYGLIPGIKTIGKVADDVVQERLQISTEDIQKTDLDIAFINSKGFGGNNATGVVLSPNIVMSMLTKRYGDDAIRAHADKLQQVEAKANHYDQAALRGDFNIVYKFGKDMIDEQAIAINGDGIEIPGLSQKVEYQNSHRYDDMC
jgi:acetoacetyl-[acyl-carrier protein] synthase